MYSSQNQNSYADPKSLLEAAFHHRFPDINFFLRTVLLVNVTHAVNASYAEHGIAIAGGSYSTFGGLNGTLGGDKGMEKRAGRLKPTTWAVRLDAAAK
jgi:hypothetical protein